MTAQIVVLLDTSASMLPNYWGAGIYYLPQAQSAASSFLFNLTTDGKDSLSVVRFADGTSMVYPSSEQLHQVASWDDLNAAATAVGQTTANGNTNMKAALGAATSLLAQASGRRGIVMLSDGQYNVGGDPTVGLGTDIPVFTIALGDHGEIACLKSIASITNAEQLTSPDSTQLAYVYCQIANDCGLATLIERQCPDVPAHRTGKTSGLVESGLSAAHFIVSWANLAVSYSSTTPVGEQVWVYLYDPSGNRVAIDPVHVGDGFVVFYVDDPMPGQWSAYAWYAGTGPEVLSCTFGIFGPVDAGAELRFTATERQVERNEPVPVSATLTEAGEPLQDVRVEAWVDRPTVSIDEAYARHAERADAVATPLEELPEEADPKTLKVLRLRQHLLPDEDILPRRVQGIPVAEREAGVHSGAVTETATPGSYNVHLKATGYSPTSKSWVERSMLRTILVQ